MEKRTEIIRTDQDDTKCYWGEMENRIISKTKYYWSEMRKKNNMQWQCFKGILKSSTGGNQRTEILLNTIETRYTDYICKEFLE